MLNITKLRLSNQYQINQEILKKNIFIAQHLQLINNIRNNLIYASLILNTEKHENYSHMTKWPYLSGAVTLVMTSSPQTCCCSGMFWVELVSEAESGFAPREPWENPERTLLSFFHIHLLFIILTNMKLTLLHCLSTILCFMWQCLLEHIHCTLHTTVLKFEV